MAENKPKIGVRQLRNRKVFTLERVKTKKERKCGLCGSNKQLTKTACCKNWICDDEDTYELFSYKTNSCWRNHQRYTLCSSHYHEDHKDVLWQFCEKCKTGIDTPNYVWYGTNDFNFEKLPNPEKVSISCSNCGFSADTIDAFFQIIENGSRKYYCCFKKKCHK